MKKSIGTQPDPLHQLEQYAKKKKRIRKRQDIINLNHLEWRKINARIKPNYLNIKK